MRSPTIWRSPRRTGATYGGMGKWWRGPCKPKRGLPGVLTSTFGGIIRDVLAGEPSVLLRRELYVTAALGGSSVFVVLRWLGLEPWPAGGLGVAPAFTIRAGAILFGWRLPGFPGRAPPER